MCHEKTPVCSIREGVSNRKVMKRCIPKKIGHPRLPLKKTKQHGEWGSNPWVSSLLQAWPPTSRDPGSSGKGELVTW